MVFEELTAAVGRMFKKPVDVSVVTPEVVESAVGIVRSQLGALDMGVAAEWGARRQYVMGYVAGLCRGLCETRGLPASVGFEATGAAWAVLSDRAPGDSSHSGLHELVDQVRAPRDAFRNATEVGRKDAAVSRRGGTPEGLLIAFGPGETTVAEAMPQGVAQTRTVAPGKTTRFRSVIVALTTRQLATADMNASDPRLWGSRQLSVIGYVSGFAQGVCETFGSPGEERVLANRCLVALFRETRDAEELFDVREELLEQRDALFLQGAQAGKKDFIRMTGGQQTAGLSALLLGQGDSLA